MERLITTIKNMTEKNKFKSLTRFHSDNNIDNYNRGGKTGGGGKGKSKRIYRASQNIRIIFFLSHYYQSPFPPWESQSTSPP